MGWLDGTMVGFDTETTGVDARSDRIVTAAVTTRVGSDGPLTSRTWLIDPGVDIPVGATAIHGVSTLMAQAEGVAPDAALEEITRLLADAVSGGYPIVGFNVAFDLGILEAELARHSLPALASRIGAPSPSDIGPIVDPLVLDRHLAPYRKGKRKLIDLCAVYEVDINADDLHSAEADVAATLDLVHAMARRYPAIADVDLRDLHDQQVEAHRVWAENFAAWLRSRGRVDDLPQSDWPLPSDWPHGSGPTAAC